MSEQGRAGYCFVVPALDGPITGGTSYNRELCAALVAASCPPQICAASEPQLDSWLARARFVWVDSLYLAELPEIRRRAPTPLGLLAHYLPSFVRLGRAATLPELSDDERAAVLAADAFLVTSDFMREAFEPLVAPGKPILVIPPGCRARLAHAPAQPSPTLRALIIANVVPGKGIEDWLRALLLSLGDDEPLRVTIVGSLDADRAYADRCRRVIAESPLLSRVVSLRGACSPEQTLTLLAESDLLLSASAMESYGMALAEARVLGVPILARAGGNAAAHVDHGAGGQCVSSVQALATACLALARDRPELDRRRARARARALAPRAWSSAAEQLMCQLDGIASLEK